MDRSKCVHERETGGAVKLQKVEVLKVGAFKDHPKQRGTKEEKKKREQAG